MKFHIMAFSFISSFGDALFLTGVPLYLYEYGGKSVFFALLFSLVINLTVVLSKKLIIQLNRKSAWSLVAAGELSMAAAEIMLLVAFFLFPSHFVLFPGIFILALIYNAYAAAKFYRLPQDFFQDNTPKQATIQSSFYRAGTLAGIIAAGPLYGLGGLPAIMIADILSFLTFGLFVLWTGKSKSTPIQTDEPKSSHQDNNATTKSPNNQNQNLKKTLFYICFSSLILSWEQSALLPIINQTFGTPLSSASIERGIYGIIGVLLGVFIGRRSQHLSLSIWKTSLTVGLGFIFIFLFIESSLNRLLIFFVFGLIGSFAISSQRELQLQAAKSTQTNTGELLAKIWIANSCTKFFLPLVGLLSDRFASFLNPIQLSILGLVALGSVGTVGTYFFIKGPKT